MSEPRPAPATGVDAALEIPRGVPDADPIVRRCHPLVFLLASAPLACAGDEVAGSGGGTTGETGLAEDSSSGGDVDTHDTTTTEAADTSTGEAFEPVPARGIVITEIEANQAVGVPVYRDGAWVDGGGRNAELFAGRNTMIRASWALDPAFTPREIEARLELSYEDGTTELATKRVLVDRDTNLSVMDTTFWFGVPGELITPLVQFQITMWETAPGGFEALPDVPEPIGYPATPAFVGIEPSDMALRVVLVPIHHDLGPDCLPPPELDRPTVAALSDYLYKQNPVNAIEVTARETITWNDDLSSFNGLLGQLAGLRDADGADPGVYYYGLVRPCDGGPEGVGGQAIDIPGFPSMGNGWSRVAVGRFYSGGIDTTANTFVHEIGHTQGRSHVACNGDEGGATPLYPYPGGIIGAWGFDIVDWNQLFKPDVAKDYMTYCGNTWVSDWGWREVVPYIREITSWDAADVAPPGGRVLVGLYDGLGGPAQWFVTTGDVAGRTPGGADTIELVDERGDGHTLPVTLGAMGDGGYNVAVALPDELAVDRLRTATRVVGTTREPIGRLRVGTAVRELAVP